MAEEAAEKAGSGEVLVAQPLLAVRFSGIFGHAGRDPSRKSLGHEWLCYFFCAGCDVAIWGDF